MAAQHLKLTSTSADAAALRAAISVLNSGEIAILPLETVYGTLVRLDHAKGLTQLRELRGRAAGSAMPLHVGSSQQAAEYIDPPNPYARRLMDHLWPGPVAMVFEVSAERRRQVAGRWSVAESDLYENALITIRCPAHRAVREVLSGVAHPVVGTPAGDGATRVDQIPQAVRDAAAIVLDDGPAAHGKPSTIIRVFPDKYDIVRAGVYDRRIIDKMLQTTILFVCSGNTCRSPMAEAIAKKVLADWLKVPQSELEKAGYTVMSAGASAFSGMPASPPAVEAVKELGGDLSRHRSRSVSEQMLNQANVIFVMGRAHAAALRAISPGTAGKVELLDPEGEIEDPIGGELGLYKSLAAKIKAILERRLENGTLQGREKRA